MDAKKVDWLKRLQILLKALEKNGVKTDMWMEIESKALGYELDFTEHDKVFEDKIDKLKKENGKLCQDNMRLEGKCVKKDDDIFNLQCENRALEKRISELDSKETENPKKINLNDRIKVKLTPLGAEIYYHQYDELNKKIENNGGTRLEPIMPQIDKDGYTEFQLWRFMELYGNHIGICKPNVIEPLDIVFCE